MWTPDELDAAEMERLRRDFRKAESLDEWDADAEESERLHRLVIIGTARRNGKELDFQIAQAAAAGLTAAEFDEALRRAGELIDKAAAAAAEVLNIMIQTINDVFAPGLAAAWEEFQKLMEEYEYFDDDQEDDRHDGATVVLVTWLLPVPTLRQLYGQGVDYGGPGPSRLTLTRVTDDGLRRAETGTKQERRTQDGHFYQYPAGPGSLHAAAGSDRRKGQREAPGRNHFFRCRHGDDRPVEYHRVRC